MKKFIFIHIPRTAGNSIVKALNIKEDSHETALQKKQKLKEQWHSYFKFTIIRNPWDRVLSWYLFCRQLKNIAAHEQEIYRLPFEKWITKGIHTHWKTSNVKFNGKHPLNLYEYVLEKNQIIVDFIGRYETLDKDYIRICKIMGIPKKHLPHIYKTRNVSDHYRKYYNGITRKIVAKKFEKDIQLFKYVF